MQIETSDPIDVLTSGPDLFFRPLGYTITMGMLVARWWPADSTPRQSIYTVFEDCKHMKVSWHGKLGPYRLSLRRLQNEQLELRDSSGEFEVICRDVKRIAKDDIPSFFRNLVAAGF